LLFHSHFNLEGKDKQGTIEKITRLAQDHLHADHEGKIRILFFTKYSSHSDKIQFKKVAKEARSRKPDDMGAMEIEEQKVSNTIQVNNQASIANNEALIPANQNIGNVKKFYPHPL